MEHSKAVHDKTIQKVNDTAGKIEEEEEDKDTEENDDDDTSWIDIGNGTFQDSDSAEEEMQSEEEMRERAFNKSLYPRGVKGKAEIIQSDGTVRTVTAKQVEKETDRWQLNLMARLEEAKRKKCEAIKNIASDKSKVQPSKSAVHLKARATLMQTALSTFSQETHENTVVQLEDVSEEEE